mmetsp:Transcript_20894/g.34982  ORF Transcript_20894/g.34982 Transcript_20894/m.34982 type:complete len:202 (+) Transcript_20894:38-643(+)
MYSRNAKAVETRSTMHRRISTDDNLDEASSPSRLQEKNARGGIKIHQQEVKDAFSLLCGDGEVISNEDLGKFIETYIPGLLSHSDIKGLVGPTGMRYEKLRKLVCDNDIVGFDPFTEAFKILDPNSLGVISEEVLKNLLRSMPGIGEVDQKDFNHLLSFMDENEDGQVTLEDFISIKGYADPSTQHYKLVDPIVQQFMRES